MELFRLDSNIDGKIVLVFILLLGQVLFKGLDFLNWGAEISLKDLGFLADERAVEGLDDWYVAGAMLDPLVGFDVVWCSYFGPVSVEQDFKLRAE